MPGLPPDHNRPALPFDIGPNRSRRAEVVVATPALEDPQVGLGMQPRLAAVAAEIRRHCRTDSCQIIRKRDGRTGSRKGVRMAGLRQVVNDETPDTVGGPTPILIAPSRR